MFNFQEAVIEELFENNIKDIQVFEFLQSQQTKSYTGKIFENIKMQIMLQLIGEK